MKYKSNMKIKKILTVNEKRALEAVGIFISGETKVRTPVDTGNLRDSYDYLVDQSKKSVAVGSSSEYSIYVEFGTGKYAMNGNGRQTPWSYKDKDDNVIWTSGQRPQPHLSPAFEENKSKIEKLISQEMRRGLK